MRPAQTNNEFNCRAVAENKACRKGDNGAKDSRKANFLPHPSSIALYALDVNASKRSGSIDMRFINESENV